MQQKKRSLEARENFFKVFVNEHTLGINYKYFLLLLDIKDKGSHFLKGVEEILV